MAQQFLFWFGCKRILFRWWRARHMEMTWLWLAKHIPKQLVYWSLIHAGSSTIVGDEEVPAVPFMDVVGRWEKR